jgi:dephospho-CoA kinase
VVVIGVCGYPAGGKSAVSAILQRLGAVWIDADTISHHVLELPQTIQLVVRQFGTAVLGVDGKIDRPRLGQIVFGDDEGAKNALRYLESIIHPRTRAEIRSRLAEAITQQRPAVVLDIPLLFEGGWDSWCDEVWFVDTPKGLILTLAAKRGWDAETLDRRIGRQLAADEKRRLSTRIIDNRGSLEDLNSIIECWWGQHFNPLAKSSSEVPN